MSKLVIVVMVYEDDMMGRKIIGIVAFYFVQEFRKGGEKYVTRHMRKGCRLCVCVKLVVNHFASFHET